MAKSRLQALPARDSRAYAVNASTSRKTLTLVLVITVLLLTLPYIQWFGVGTASDVQPYPLVVAVMVILLLMRFRRAEDNRVLAFVVFAGCLGIVQLLVWGGGLADIVRGLFGYVSLGFLVWAWVLLIRRYGPIPMRKALAAAFWLWLGVGAAQLIDPQFANFWRDKLIITTDRGALSFATEPAYFAFALTLLALSIVRLGGRYSYLVVATLGTILIAQSAIGLFYSIAALLLFTPALISRKLLAIAVAGVGWATVIVVAPTSRIARGSVQILTDPMGLVSSDMSVGLRYINLALPVRAFIEDFGRPHGVTAWAAVLYELFPEHASAYAWRIVFVSESSGRILSVHGQLLFELGIFAIIFFVLLWRLFSRSSLRLAYSALIFILFLNGMTLNSPFFALMLAVAFVEPEIYPTCTDSRDDRRRDARLYKSSPPTSQRRGGRPTAP